MSMARRAIPSAKSVEDAFETLRGGWFKAVHNHHVKHSGGSKVSAILDVGCATGNSTRYLADKFPDADVTVSGLTDSEPGAQFCQPSCRTELGCLF